jgi:hypothetical protein
MNPGIKIEDNFLEQNVFGELQTIIMNERFDWHYTGTIDYEGQKDKFQFTHMFYIGMTPCSPHFKDLSPILELIQPVSIFRIKSNLLTKTPNIVKNAFHVDMNMPEENLKQWTTSIFYLNTNDGYTEFQDGRIEMENTKVKSVANRLVTFPTNMNHTGTSCTDEKIRIVINFDYYSK